LFLLMQVGEIPFRSESAKMHKALSFHPDIGCQIARPEFLADEFLGPRRELNYQQPATKKLAVTGTP
jgi:hypothetical protein